MPTGEIPAVVVDQRTRFAWPVVVALVGVAIAAAGGIARATSAEECCKEATAAQHQHELRIQRAEDGQAVLMRALERIEMKVDELRDEQRRRQP